jgi:hypothetical protein
MNKGILLVATLTLMSAPAFAQAPVGGADRTLGNGSVESASPRIADPVPTTSARPPSRLEGGVDRTLGNGNVESAAPRIGDPVSTSSVRPPAPGEGGVDRSLGNGNVYSSSPIVPDPVATPR